MGIAFASSPERPTLTKLLSSMAGKPFKVGRFAHTLRVRLMREHLGVDVDSMYEEDLMATKSQKSQYNQEAWDPDHEEGSRSNVTRVKEKGSTLGIKGAVVEGGFLRECGLFRDGADISLTRSRRCSGRHHSH